VKRRKFLHQASCAAVGSTTFLSSFYNLTSINVAAGYANTTDFKALVCILLAGGNDSFNMLVPTDNDTYNEYATTRSNLALSQSSLLPLDGLHNGRLYGIHPSLANIQSIFNNGSLSFLSNVGSLVEPTSKENYVNGSACLPLGLFSHADEIAHWQTSTPNTRSSIGWGGRMADVLAQSNAMGNISMNISMSGTNLFQTGNNMAPFTLTPDGSIGINGYGDQDLLSMIKTASIDSIFAQHYDNLYDATYTGILRNSQDAHIIYQTAINNLEPIQTSFNQENDLAIRLERILKTIAVQEDLGMNRQIFFVNVGGWDHHDEVLNTQSGMLSSVDEAIGQFYDGLVELELLDEVTSFTISDFGRTLTSNGNGTDHAWGGNHFVFGGSVDGGKIYGTYPSLVLDGSLDIGRGRLIPTTASDLYFAEIARWFGVDNSNLDMVLPNIEIFYDLQSSAAPLGFMLV